MRFIIQKFIHASSLKEVIKKEKLCPIHEVFLDPEWKKINDEKNEWGFNAPIKKKIDEKQK